MNIQRWEAARLRWQLFIAGVCECPARTAARTAGHVGPRGGANAITRALVNYLVQ